jgi:hypothetical protein
MQQNYQDAMAVVRKHGKPDLFITFTCNPNWKEVVSSLLPGQQPQDRPDIITRVFQQKLKSLMDDLKYGHIFGVPIAFVYVIEFQKRGLPHAHILLILRHQDKLHLMDHIDEIISAELPDPNNSKFKELFEIVSKNLVHGPCGHFDPQCVCMEDGKCSKNFPKELRDETNTNFNGYPLYRRRNNGVHFFKTVKGNKIKVTF